MATLTLNVSPTPDAPPAPSGKGFVGGLEAGWHALTGFTAGLVVVFGALLPWIGALAVLAGIFLAIYLPGRKKRAAKREAKRAARLANRPPVPAPWTGGTSPGSQPTMPSQAPRGPSPAADAEPPKDR
jgi:hypothetical protein